MKIKGVESVLCAFYFVLTCNVDIRFLKENHDVKCKMSICI